MDDIQPKRIFNNPHNFCTKRFQCKHRNVCEKIIICDTHCASCIKCNQGVLLSRNIDLKRKPHFKPRKHTKKGIQNRTAFLQRTYADFRLLNRCSEGAVKAVIDQMERALGTYNFLTVFEICLTDRGSEFGNPNQLETGIDGIERMSVYYSYPRKQLQ